jgi:hypothetical protein
MRMELSICCTTITGHYASTLLTTGKQNIYQAGLSITWTPLHLVFFSLFWGHVFFAFHNLGTFRSGELLKLV